MNWNPTRRDTLHLAGLGAGLSILGALLPGAARAGKGPLHGLSVFGDLKYPADFTHLDYVNPDAPKGGSIVTTPSTWGFNQNPETFNTFNTFILKGDAPPQMDELTYDSMMVRALDEPDAVYGLIAETVEISDDGNTYRFNLRPQAKFRDGSPLTADDVVFTLRTLAKDGHQNIRKTIQQMTDVRKIGPHTVDVVFSGKQSRQLPIYVAGLPVLSSAWYSTRDFTVADMQIPLGSGPYRVGRFDPGVFIEYDRVPDWWAKDLPIARGHNNFDRIRIEFYRERVIAFEAFKKGRLTFYEEFHSRRWATEYKFPAIVDGRVKRNTFPDNRPAGAQGWFINTRRDKFKDVRTREAIGLVFDFEWSNKNLFYGLYQRTSSWFQNSEMMAEGPPGPEELALLEPFRDKLPEAVFGEPWTAPKSDGSGRPRDNLRRAARLLKEAGWVRKGSVLVDKSGQPFEIEMLTSSSGFDRIVQPYENNLKLIGVTMRRRRVDSAQFQSRLKSFDFDMLGRRFAMSATPSEYIRQFWSAKAAEEEGSNNYSGISDPVVDALIEKMIHARTRADMTFAARALDRVLRIGHYWVPQWYKASHNVAYWDKFGWPEKKPRYEFPVQSTWWAKPGSGN